MAKQTVTTQERQALMNVINKNVDPDILTIDLTKIDPTIVARRAHNAAHPPDPEKNWREELSQLESRLRNAWTFEQAKQHADAEGRKWKEAIDKVETAIKEHRELLKTPYLSLHSGWNGTERRTESQRGSVLICGCDGCVLLRKIEHLEGQLPDLKKQQQGSIRKCGAMIESCKENDKLRPRYRELAQRAAKIDQATARNTVNDDGRFRDEGTPTRSNPAAHRLGYTGLQPE